jgi:hypothetical protein
VVEIQSDKTALFTNAMDGAMRKVIFVFLLVIISSSAAAGWFRIDKDGKLTVYADPTSRRRSGNFVKVWVMNDLKTFQVIPGTEMSYLSVKVRREYDCKEVRAQSLNMVYYSGNMGSGQMVNSISFSEPNWIPVVPGTLEELLWKLNCLKR